MVNKISSIEVLSNERLAADVFCLMFYAPHIAFAARAGQFVMLMAYDKSERIPLTIAESDAAAGSVTVVFKVMGRSTSDLSLMKKGESLFYVAGPLGKATEFPASGRAIAVGGGIGLALILPVIKEMRDKGLSVTTIAGVREKKFLFWEDKLSSGSEKFYLTSDDGSCGGKGFVTGPLRRELDASNDIKAVYAVGPVIMMKTVADLTREYGVKTIVSLNPIMVDGTGMCGSCRVKVSGKVRFACVDGPDFDAHEVDFDELLSRLTLYNDKEKEAFEAAHKCRCL
ncbi:sulfide/dihydroorotate dehydrogenase-like FAD/NAD-binding protein [bacterium]|nr:sulfide/dihydroorotate dehydrogenase-like FAD/NAD-binding protein [bacterium]MBU3955347.1 sulfide/dihydroorotate dehydrogenase-like FAD/NAD-binding protein [bacterium]MBU4134470.1 sulfide/dihydroorotate dehydrogenase-like FAD/NAD-binding protein [bacterium]